MPCSHPFPEALRTCNDCVEICMRYIHIYLFIIIIIIFCLRISPPQATRCTLACLATPQCPRRQLHHHSCRVPRGVPCRGVPRGVGQEGTRGLYSWGPGSSSPRLSTRPPTSPPPPPPPPPPTPVRRCPPNPPARPRPISSEGVLLLRNSVGIK